MKGRILLLILVCIIAGVIFYLASTTTTKKTSRQTFASTNAQATLTVNASQTKGTFSRNMLGLDLANWEFIAAWNKPMLGDAKLKPVVDAYRAINPGYLRFAGGNWANDVGFDRQPQRNPNEDFSFNGKQYGHNYGTDELEKMNTVVKSLNADMMIEVNVTEDDPSMWADMVRYTNIEKKWGFKYWEIGNENEATWNGSAYLNPDEYMRRYIAYEKAMKAVDPSIVVIGPAAAAPHTPTGNATQLNREFRELPGKLKTANGREMGALTWHWYISYQDETIGNLLRYSVPGTNGFWGDAERGRQWADIVGKAIEEQAVAGRPTLQGVTEINTLADNRDHIQQNHIAALFLSDALPRLASNGVDFASIWLGYSQFGSSFGMVQHTGEGNNLRLNSTYYLYYMLANHFGDTLVSASTTNQEKLSIWASKDTDDPGSIQLLITNMGDADIIADVVLQNFIGKTAYYYELTPDGTIGAWNTSGNVNVYSLLNGKKIDIYNLDSSLAQIQPKTLALSGAGFTKTFPRYSVTTVLISQDTSVPTNTVAPTSAQPSATPTPSATPSKTPVPTAGPSPTAGPTPSTIQQPSPTTIPGASATTAPTKAPTPTSIPTTNCPKRSKGDANCDGKVNMVDLEWWVREFIEEIGTKNADFNGQSTCNKKDGSPKATCSDDFIIWRNNFLL